MDKKNKEIQEIKNKIVPILKKNRIKKAGIFGSFARGEQSESSDIDILIQPDNKQKFSLIDLAALEIELKKILNKDVDLLTYNSIYYLLKDKILKEEIKII